MAIVPNPIVWRLHLPVPPDRVYAALNSDAGRQSFWAESAVEQDGVIHFHFINGIRYASRLLSRTPSREWTIEYFGGAARFELVADGRGGTDVTLTHSGVAEADRVETYAGWLNVLLPLKAWLAHGIDLRNHDPQRTWDDGYVDQ